MNSRNWWCFALAALAVLPARTAVAQNFVREPFLGKSCSAVGANCTFDSARRVNFQGSILFDWVGRNVVSIRILRDASLDPNVPGNWVERTTVTTDPGINWATSSAIRLVEPAAGFDTWRDGGLARVVVTRFDENGGFHDHFGAQLLASPGVSTPYPGGWGLAGRALDPTLSQLGDPAKSIFVLSGDTVTPADQAKPGHFLTFKRSSIVDPIADTLAYYRKIKFDQVSTLAAFKTKYGMSANDTPVLGEFVARYYNRGDLGIGRDMHCKVITNETACYVSNYGSFGGSPPWSSTAASGFDPTRLVATVAMVSRTTVAKTDPDKVIFLVYGKDGRLATEAPLDQHADKKLGRDGIDYNRHVPTNCMACHGAGGSYTPQTATNVASRGAVGALFLPFDLDQFDFHPTRAPLSRANQEASFKTLNTSIAGRVALEYGNPRGSSIMGMVNGWYDVRVIEFDPLIVESSPTFIGSYVPPGWSPTLWDGWYGDAHFYRKVIRPYCRGCHMTFSADNPLSFESWDQYDARYGIAKLRVCPPAGAGNVMPHAEQTMRLFWKSDARGAFVGYSSWKGDDIKDCIPNPD